MGIETVYTSLTRTFKNAGSEQDIIINNQPDDGNKELLIAQSPEELKALTQQLKQQYYLDRQQQKVVENAEQNALVYQSQRLPAYFDYEMMETYPLIAQALNLLAEEATTIGDNAKMLNVYSENNTIKAILEELFYYRLDINTNLYYWTRNTVKYGDNYILLNTNFEKGVIGARQLPNIEIDRVEKVNTKTGDLTLMFNWKNKSEEYQNWQIAHFRLLGNDKMLPYGTSVLAPVRQYWRMLRMAEDAMLVYRATRAATRRVIKVNVGNADPADAAQIVQAAAMNFKKSALVDPQTGQINYKFNPATVEQDIFVAVRNDGVQTPIETLDGKGDSLDIVDLNYLVTGLLAGLGIPKQFLAYANDSVGEGAGGNLSILDIRFARKIVKIQQCILQELNKIAIIHLMILGYEGDDLRNFKLTLTNPSTQSEMLQIKNLQEKVTLYKDLTDARDKGIAPYSHTKAMREIFHLSDDEIILDIKQQLIENIVGEEVKNAITKIKSSGIFDDLQKYYNFGVLDQNSPALAPGEKASPEGLPAVPSETGGSEQSSPTEPESSPTPEQPSSEPLKENKFVNKNKLLSNDIENLLDELEQHIKKNKEII